MEEKINTVAKMKERLLIARFESLNVKNIHFLRDWAEFDGFYVDLPEEGGGWGSFSKKYKQNASERPFICKDTGPFERSRKFPKNHPIW